MHTVNQKEVSDIIRAVSQRRINLVLNGEKIGYECARSEVDSGILEKLNRQKPTIVKMMKEETLGLDFVVTLRQVENASMYIVCIHTGHGGVMDYRNFAMQLTDGFGVYGIQAHNFLRNNSEVESVKSLAGSYAKIVASRFSDLPIVLYGLSAGGLIAMEMAKMLSARSIHPRLLILGDTMDMSRTTELDSGYLNRMEWINFIEAYFPAEILAIESNGSKLWALKSEGHEFWILDTQHRLDYLIAQSERLNTDRTLVPLRRSEMNSHFESHSTLTRAYFRHVPTQYEGKCLFLRATETELKRSENVRSMLTGDLVVREIPGGHTSLLSGTGASLVSRYVQEELV